MGPWCRSVRAVCRVMLAVRQWVRLLSSFFCGKQIEPKLAEMHTGSPISHPLPQLPCRTLFSRVRARWSVMKTLRSYVWSSTHESPC